MLYRKKMMSLNYKRVAVQIQKFDIAELHWMVYRNMTLHQTVTPK